MGTSKINILYLADPYSIHDVKWMTFFTKIQFSNGFLIVRDHHIKMYKSESLPQNGIVFTKSIPDYSLVRFFRTILTAVNIKKLVKERKIDVIHILYAEPNALWCTLRLFFGVPMIITCRGTDVLKTIPETFSKKTFINFFIAPLYKLAFRSVDWITCTSQKQKESIFKFSSIKNRVSIVRTGVDTQFLLSNTKEYFPLKDNRPYILFPRYIRPIYNHEFCLEAIKLLPVNIKKKYKMVFVGKDSGDLNYQKDLESTMYSLGDVSFEFIEKQHQQGVFELYKRASLVIMTPKSDGSPVSAMEALLCGAKVILGPLDYDKEVLSENVIKLGRWSSSELSEKIQYTLSSSLVEGKLSSNTKLLMDRIHNMNKMKNLYRNVINGVKK